MAMDIRIDRVASLFSEGNSALEPSRAELRERRAALLHEPLTQRYTRIAGVIGRALAPRRLGRTLAALDLLVRDRSICAIDLPDPEQALADPDGLCGHAADLSRETILDAYSRGLCLEGALGRPTWWAPAKRHLATPGALRLTGQVRLHLHRQDMHVRFDRATDEVVAACARPQPQAGNPGYGAALAQTYVALADAGILHSVEIRDAGGRLTGGLFGLSLGSIFVVERTFGAADTVDLALVMLARHLEAWNYGLIDVRAMARFAPLGFEPVSRREHRRRIMGHLNGGRGGRWQVEAALLPLDPAAAARSSSQSPSNKAVDR
jgi:leucyl/phenylalanyl-tRNA---protein transferase